MEEIQRGNLITQVHLEKWFLKWSVYYLCHSIIKLRSFKCFPPLALLEPWYYSAYFGLVIVRPFRCVYRTSCVTFKGLLFYFLPDTVRTM